MKKWVWIIIILIIIAIVIALFFILTKGGSPAGNLPTTGEGIPSPPPIPE